MPGAKISCRLDSYFGIKLAHAQKRRPRKTIIHLKEHQIMQSPLSSLRMLQGQSLLSTTILLALFSIAFGLFLLGRELPVQLGKAKHGLPWMEPVSEPSAKKGFFVHAIVRRIDYRSGLVDIETEIGSFYAIADQDGLTSLHTGDEITVYVVDENAPVVYT